ncbi:DUF5677 domain-containing protein [Streptomyces hirsutus]|uniref:DUF5677 domain-containing protein n=1 Tax=Streptomyces hirsutus TaxID=35620 RepID=UPI0038675455|nr:DUF5677 domain-containing protein [Streptomyces hirsutus]
MSNITQQQYRDAIEKLITDFQASRPIETKQRKYRSVLIGHGWCTEVHRLAEAALHLVDRGFAHEALILLRTMFETTVSLHWLSQKDDAGALGVFAEGGRVNRAAVKDMQVAFSVPQDLIDQINSEPVERTDESEIFRRFQAQCDEIDPQKQLYTVYRYLCGYAHPSSISAFAFIEPSTEPPSLRSEPKEGSSSVVEVTTAMCLIWAGRAFDEMVNGKPRKQILRSTARELGLKPILPAIS